MEPDKKNRFWWPAVDTIAAAKSASNYGFWAATLGAVIAAVLATWSTLSGNTVLEDYNRWAFVDAGLFAAVALGIYLGSRFAAIAGLLLFVAEKAFALSATGQFAGIWMDLIFALMYINGIRGVYGLHQLRANSSAN